MKLADISSVAGTSVIRDGEFASLGLIAYETAGLLVFVESANYLNDLAANARIGCVITTSELAGNIPGSLGVATTTKPREAFYTLHNHLAQTEFYGKRFASEVSTTARVHPRAYVAEHNVRIGDNCVVEPNATIHEGAVLDEGVIVRSGAIIGSEGFQFTRLGDRLLAVAHAGGVRLERGVEIQSCTCVDRALFGGFTIIGEDSKIDNLVHIAHNVRLGKRNLVVAGAMIAGSVISGDDVWFGPQCAISNGLTVGSRATITVGAVVTKNVEEGTRVSGNFAVDHARFLMHMRAIR